MRCDNHTVVLRRYETDLISSLLAYLKCNYRLNRFGDRFDSPYVTVSPIMSIQIRQKACRYRWMDETKELYKRFIMLLNVTFKLCVYHLLYFESFICAKFTFQLCICSCQIREMIS